MTREREVIGLILGDSPMTKTQVEVITSVHAAVGGRAPRRNGLSREAMSGAVASEVARAAGIHVSQLFRWRQQLRGAAAAAPVFSPPEKNQQPTMEFIARCHEGVNWRPKFDN